MPTKRHYYVEERGAIYRLSKTQLTRLLNDMKHSRPYDLENYGPRLTRNLLSTDSLLDDPGAKMNELWSRDHEVR